MRFSADITKASNPEGVLAYAQILNVGRKQKKCHLQNANGTVINSVQPDAKLDTDVNIISEPITIVNLPEKERNTALLQTGKLITAHTHLQSDMSG